MTKVIVVILVMPTRSTHDVILFGKVIVGSLYFSLYEQIHYG